MATKVNATPKKLVVTHASLGKTGGMLPTMQPARVKHPCHGHPWTAPSLCTRQWEVIAVTLQPALPWSARRAILPQFGVSRRQLVPAA